MIYICGPGHGGPGMVANTWLEGTYTEYFPNVTQDALGMKRLFTQFSFPGGIPSHAAPETPGSINEGGELGYSLVHAYGAAFDNPDLIVTCVIGDGEAETGALATSWHSNKFLNPARDGAVIPILHLNGYKIAGPTVLARIPRHDLASLLEGYGYRPYFVEGHDPEPMHQTMAETIETVVDEIRAIQKNARENGFRQRPVWPMIVMITPKGWTGSQGGGWSADGRHLPRPPSPPDGSGQEAGTRPDSGTVDEKLSSRGIVRRRWQTRAGAHGTGAQRPAADERESQCQRRFAASGSEDAGLPDYAVAVPKPGTACGEATRALGCMLRDILTLNRDARNFRIFGPDETSSNRLDAVFEVTNGFPQPRFFPSTITSRPTAG